MDSLGFLFLELLDELLSHFKQVLLFSLRKVDGHVLIVAGRFRSLTVLAADIKHVDLFFELLFFHELDLLGLFLFDQFFD